MADAAAGAGRRRVRRANFAGVARGRIETGGGEEGGDLKRSDTCKKDRGEEGGGVGKATRGEQGVQPRASARGFIGKERGGPSAGRERESRRKIVMRERIVRREGGEERAEAKRECESFSAPADRVGRLSDSVKRSSDR